MLLSRAATVRTCTNFRFLMIPGAVNRVQSVFQTGKPVNHVDITATRSASSVRLKHTYMLHRIPKNVDHVPNVDGANMSTDSAVEYKTECASRVRLGIILHELIPSIANDVRSAVGKRRDCDSAKDRQTQFVMNANKVLHNLPYY